MAEPDPGLVAALLAAAAGAPPPPGARRLVRLDLPPASDLDSAAAWLVVNPVGGGSVLAPIEVCGEGLRLWHERARAIGLEPGMVAWVVRGQDAGGG